MEGHALSCPKLDADVAALRIGRRDDGAVDGASGGVGDVAIGEAGEIGAVRIDFEFHFRAFLEPVVLHHLHTGRDAQDILHLARKAFFPVFGVISSVAGTALGLCGAMLGAF